MSKPVLVLLHGFLGAASDWQELQTNLPDVHCVALDLPGHGASADMPLHRMADFPAWLYQQLTCRNIRHYHLLGYSLGGRLALQFAVTRPEGLQSLILENAHPGLDSPTARANRAQADARWAKRFYREKLTEVLADWYQQPVFHDLSPHERAQLIIARSHNQPRALASMLCRCSLARQASYQDWIKTTSLPMLYLCGEQDLKFRTVGEQLAATNPQLHVTCLAGGHNLHRANPDSMAVALRQWLNAFTF